MAKDRDLFAENNIDPSQVSGNDGGRDLFAENNIDPALAQRLKLGATRPLRNIAAGLGEAGQNVYNFIAPKSMQSTTNIPEALGANNPSIGDLLFRTIGKFAPAALISRGESIPGELAGIGAQGLYGAAQAPENRTAGFAAGGLGAVLPGAAEGTANVFKPSNLLRGNLSPEELAQNLEQTAGTQTGLGRVIGSPALSRLQENILPHVPFGGAESTMQQNANLIKEKGSDLLENIRGDTPLGNYGQMMQDALKKSSKEARDEKNLNYQKVNDIADKSNLTIGRENFSSSAQKALEDINQSPELKREMGSSLIHDLEEYATNAKGNSLKLSNIFKGKLNDKANELYSNGNMYEYGLISQLKDALGKDIDTGILNSGNENLKNSYLEAQKNYAEKFAPFEDKDIVKFTRQGGDPDTLLQFFLRGGQSDRATLLNKFVSKLPEQAKNLPTYAYLSKAIENGEVNPLKLRSLYNSLGENQKNVLFSDKDLKKSIENYTGLVGKNTEAFDLMRNPKTGARNQDLLQALVQAAIGGQLAGMPGMITGAVGGAAGSQLMNKLLTSPTYREALVNAMIKNKKMNIPGKRFISPGISGYLNQQISEGQ